MHPFNALGKTFKLFAYPFKKKASSCLNLNLKLRLEPDYAYRAYCDHYCKHAAGLPRTVACDEVLMPDKRKMQEHFSVDSRTRKPRKVIPNRENKLAKYAKLSDRENK